MKHNTFLKLFYLTPPILLVLFLVVLYGPVLLGLGLPAVFDHAQILTVRVLFVVLRAAFLICGLGGILQTVRCLRHRPIPAVLLVLLGLGYLAIGVWLILLGIVFHT